MHQKGVAPRVPIKHRHGVSFGEQLPDSSWRQAFKQRCMDRIRHARAQVVWNRRFGISEPTVSKAADAGDAMLDPNTTMHIATDVGVEVTDNDIRMALAHEMQLLANDSNMDILDADEGSKLEQELLCELHNQRAQEEMIIFDEYGSDVPFEYLICPVCQHPSLATNHTHIDCTGCSLSIPRQIPSLANFHTELEYMANQHRHSCHGILHAGFNSVTGMFLMCTHCDEMMIV
ncbi:hypothetical protein BASA50_007441 [Batrachochytrium salamandrivorans]|uniref:RPA-interacting protein C-terminal domain-containing protein n=1 Tax=Batrachochytrium salamandrivorans TaxID=1357716 RepID=A0ABQ8F9Q1_9FUNG|nr:hypothetical protein BASA62_008980 [Batrachochytrium salamandrivorans]KAH6584644.1 hypothetical protein BASA60_000904 [Batrachochytrium salamandrivorans]KAH6587515.1 hypothetical protein BASA61_006240 [Batrachochytrium salamandrivorans]KAH6593234.1 hypothetical protein BASA50_007441 [Batrachochytrium salamandrivorans]KAH9274137.1 hypothetical protein BASA83_003439 [Batrachochytrium salamandrivorans]